MTYDFPASVHKDDYANSLIAVDLDDYRRLYAQGWRLSQDFLNGTDDPLMSQSDTPKRPRGRPRKEDGNATDTNSNPGH
jgi:hypothetical protein